MDFHTFGFHLATPEPSALIAVDCLRFTQIAEVQAAALETFVARSPGLLATLAQFRDHLQALVDAAASRCQAAAPAAGGGGALGTRQAASYDETARVLALMHRDRLLMSVLLCCAGRGLRSAPAIEVCCSESMNE